MAVGVGLALASSQGTAHADSGSPPAASSSDSSRSESSEKSDPAGGPKAAQSKRPPRTEPSRTSLSAGDDAEDDTEVASAATKRKRHSDVDVAQGAVAMIERPASARAGASPVTRTASRLRERAAANPLKSVAHARPAPAHAPTAGDMAETPYGDIGKWMVQPNGHIADWLGQKYENRNLLEPVNLVIVDRSSTTPEESTKTVVAALSAAGFPPMALHGTGQRGVLNGVLYDQEPTGAYEAFSNCFFLFPNDHARLFGPAPAPDGVGYVWTAAASRERVGVYDSAITHQYMSFNVARDTLRDSLVRIGGIDLGMVNLHNDVHNRIQATGDHDGYAAVIELGSAPAPRRRLSV